MTDQEINEAVARKLGWTQCGDHWHSPHKVMVCEDCAGNDWPLDYCRSIEAAWEIVQWFGSNDINFNVWKSNPKSKWVCAIAKNLGTTQEALIQELADTAPMAICLAFLKLKGGDSID